MGDDTAIQWTAVNGRKGATWNPTTGCDRVSPGCANCYAMTMAVRLKKMGQAAYQKDGDPRTSGPGFALQMHEDRLTKPLRWKAPRGIFVDSMSDLFHPEVTDEFLDQVFAVMAMAPQHIFQVLTKRPERMREYVSDPGLHQRIAQTYIQQPGWPDGLRRTPVVGTGLAWPLPNVWLGTSVENARWRTRIEELRQTPAAIRFLSCEPLLGPLTNLYTGTGRPMFGESPQTFLDLTGIDWVIIGGESGSGARPLDEQWVRDIVAACRRQGAAPYVKQLGERWASDHLGHHGHAGDPTEWPEDLRVREFPGGSTVGHD